MHKQPSIANLWEQTAGRPIGAPELEDGIRTDVIIIGGGFTGCAAALELARAGTSVCLIEANQVGYGGSGRNVGLVNAGLWLEPVKVEALLGESPGGRLNRLLGSGPDEVFSLIHRYGIECQPVRSGNLHCAHSAAGMANLEQRANQYRRLGASVELLSKEETMTKTGTDQFVGSLLDHRAGTIQPLAYVRGLARAAMKQGVSIYERSAVRSVEFRDGEWQAKTGRGSASAEALVLATNAYHQDLNIGARPQYIPVHFLQFATAPLPEELRHGILPERQGAWDTARVMTSFRLDADGRLLLGTVGALEGAAQSIHRAWIRRKCDRLFPTARDCAFEYAWSGRIAMTGDHLPKIIDDGRKFLSIHGYSGRGIAPGTVFGTMVAKYLLSGDAGHLPLAPIEAHPERLVLFKQGWYELGAGAFHFISSRRRVT